MKASVFNFKSNFLSNFLMEVLVLLRKLCSCSFQIWYYFQRGVIAIFPLMGVLLGHLIDKILPDF